MYDALGRRVTLTYPDKSVATYAYDEHGRMTTISAGGQKPLAAYVYNQGQLAEIDRDNGVATHYSYDADGQIAAVNNTIGARIFIPRRRPPD